MNYHQATWARIELDRQHNVIAASLSLLLPGLGHIYKAHYGAGVAILLGAPLCLWVGLLLSPFAFGLSPLIPIFYWAVASAYAFYMKDRRPNHRGYVP